MAENALAPQLANFDAGQLASMSAQERATFSAALVKAGFSQTSVDAKLGSLGQQPSQQTPRQTTQQPLGVETLDSFTKLPGMSPSQLEQAAEQLQRHWTGDPQVLREAFERAGLHEVKIDDTRTAQEREFDHAFGGGAPSDYELGGLYVGRATGIDPTALAVFDGQLREALSQMGVPLAMGRGIAETLLKGADEYGRLPEGPARDLWKAEQRALLERIGHDSADNLTRYAAHALAKLPKETLAAWDVDGALHSAAVILQLARHGERLYDREQMKQR